MRRIRDVSAYWMPGVKAAAVLFCVSTMMSAQTTIYSVFPAVSQDPHQSAVEQHSGQRITLHVKDSTIEYALNAIADQAHLSLVYNHNLILTKKITVHLDSVAVEKALAMVLRGTGLVARMAPDGETVVVRAKAGLLGGKTRVDSLGTVSGRVTDSASGQGVNGAAVTVAGTKLSAMTSDTGKFTLRNVPVGDHELVVRLFGYKPVVRLVTVVDSQRTAVHITLVPVATMLSGVVTTAAGLQRRIEVGNDITVLNADSIQQIAPVSTITDMLETRVPGLVVQHTSGIPGAPSRLRLRGISSINSSSDPIVIVDGIRVYADQSGTRSAYKPNGTHQYGTSTGGGSTVGGGTVLQHDLTGSNIVYAGPSALDQIDPNSIATIEVLKGPSATAIYGSDAGSGVIVITTKKGRVGPTHWNVVLDHSRTTLPTQWPVNWYAFGSTSSPPFSARCDPTVSSEAAICRDSVVAFQALNDPRYSPLTGRAGQNNDVSLTVSGGSGALTYSVTGTVSGTSGYLHLPAIEQERFQLFHSVPVPSWMVTPDQYTTWSGGSQLMTQLGTSGTNISLTSSLFHSAQQQSSLQNDLAGLSQMYVDTTQLAAQPLFPDYYTRVQFGTETFTNAVTLSNWAPWRWLPLDGTLGLNVGSTNNTSLLPRDFITCLGNTYDSACGRDSLGTYVLNQGTNRVVSLTARTTLAQGQLVSTAVGLNVYTTAQSLVGTSQLGLPIGVNVPSSFNNLGATQNVAGSSSYAATNVATYGYYVQPTLNLNSKFFASPGFRLDGGSASGGHSGISGSGLSAFPKLDLSYVAVNRPPSDPLFGALTLLRPRIAFGIAGVQPALGQQLRLLDLHEATPLTASGAGAPSDVLSVTTIGNPDLHPERDQEIEGGVDVTLGNDRLSVTLTGYRKTAKDAILDMPLAPSIYGGQFNQARNIGTIRNTGMELTGSVRLLDSRAVAWSMNANVTKNTNEVVSLVSGQLPIIEASGSGYQTRLTPGYPINGFWAAPVASFADANHDGRIETNEVIVGDSVAYLGAPIPNYEMTLSTTLTLFNGRVSLNTALDYQHGLTQLNQSASLFNGQFLNPTVTPAQQAAIAISSLSNGSAIGLIQTVNVLRWNTLSLNVLVPPSLSRRVRVPTMSVALQGSNLGVHTNYRGADPNVNAYASGNLTADTGQLPQPRIWGLRVFLGN